MHRICFASFIFVILSTFFFWFKSDFCHKIVPADRNSVCLFIPDWLKLLRGGRDLTTDVELRLSFGSVKVRNLWFCKSCLFFNVGSFIGFGVLCAVHFAELVITLLQKVQLKPTFWCGIFSLGWRLVGGLRLSVSAFRSGYWFYDTFIVSILNYI